MIRCACEILPHLGLQTRSLAPCRRRLQCFRTCSAAASPFLGGLDGLAGAFGNVFPAVSCGCAGAGRTGASSAIVVALEHNAEAFVHGRLPYTGDLPMTAAPPREISRYRQRAFELLPRRQLSAALEAEGSLLPSLRRRHRTFRWKDHHYHRCGERHRPRHRADFCARGRQCRLRRYQRERHRRNGGGG